MFGVGDHALAVTGSLSSSDTKHTLPPNVSYGAWRRDVLRFLAESSGISLERGTIKAGITIFTESVEWHECNFALALLTPPRVIANLPI